MSGENCWCVKMHDLVLAFVLGRISRGDHPWIIYHGDISKWSGDDISESCERISLSCNGMSKFTRELRCPRLSLLQLMHGDVWLTFSYNFYENMKNVQVIAFYQMYHALLPRSLQCSSNLKSLCLNGCKFMLDCSSVGDLVNLEVLSFPYCGIRKLPSTIWNLRKLKLLDLTGCVSLYIDNGVFKNLENLEELYMRVSGKKSIRFTYANFEELKMLSSKLYAFEVEFMEKNTQLKNFSFKELHEFKIAIGCLLEEGMYNPLKNTLKLVSDSKNDLHDCKIIDLFKKTEELYLDVKDMTGLEDFVSIHPYDRHSFSHLRDLEVYNCVEMKYLCTVSVASGLRKLERLKVSSCSALEALIQNDGREINCVDDIIKFDLLKFLSLRKLPKMVSLFLLDNVVELPQLVELEVDGLPNFISIYPDKNNISALLNSQVRVSKLKKLKIKFMKNLKQIWACEITDSEVTNISMLKEIEVVKCDSLVNLFPINPMRLLNHLERLRVKKCGSIEVIFNIDMEFFGIGDVEKLSTNRLRNIQVEDSWSFRKIWRINEGENNLSSIHRLKISQGLVDSWLLRQYSRTIYIYTCDALSVVIPSYAVEQMQNLQVLNVSSCASLVEVFETQETNNNNSSDVFDEGNGSTNTTTLAIPRLENISVPQLFNLKKLVITCCNLLQHVFTFFTLESLRQLEELMISKCEAMKVIVTKANDEQRKVVLFPRLKSLQLFNLPNLNGFFMGMNEFQWPLLEKVMISQCPQMTVFTSRQSIAPKLKYIHTSLGKHSLECGLNFHMTIDLHQIKLTSSRSTTIERLPWSFHNLIEMDIKDDREVKCIIPSNKLLQLHKLEKIKIYNCLYVEEVFDEAQTIVEIPNLRQVKLKELYRLKCIWKSYDYRKIELLSFPNLTTLSIHSCHSLKHVFTSSMLGSLLQLQDLHISRCQHMDVIVKDEKEESVDGVFEVEGMEGTKSESQTHVVQIPNLRQVKLEWVGLKCIWKSDHHVFKFPNLTTLSIDRCHRLTHVFTSSMVGSLLQLQDLHISHCKALLVVVKEEEEVESKYDAKVKEIVMLPCLKSMKLDELQRLKGFCLGNDSFSWPSLRTLEIIDCPEIKIFTKGHLVTPALNIIDTCFGRCYISEDINSFIKNKQLEEFQF